MKLVFRGWRREVTTHDHPVTPVENNKGRYSPKGKDQPLIWDGGLNAYGKVDGLALSGSFLVEFKFDEREIENWLLKYVKEHPEQAIRVLSQAHAEATIALSKKLQLMSSLRTYAPNNSFKPTPLRGAA